MKQDDRAGQDPQQRERPDADHAAQQPVERGDQAAGIARHPDGRRVHPASSRARLRNTSTLGGSSLCQAVTLASR